MTFADIAINEEFKDGGVTFVKLSDSTAQGPKYHWRDSSIFTFEPEDEVEEFCRWRLP
jgi:hypothetical protein